MGFPDGLVVGCGRKKHLLLLSIIFNCSFMANVGPFKEVACLLLVGKGNL